MPIVDPFSLRYRIIFGKHQGRECVVRESNSKDQLFVFFDDRNYEKGAWVGAGEVVEMKTPGWAKAALCIPLGLEEFMKEKGTGLNRLRTEDASQPGAVRVGDVLATGERVDERRSGFNDQPLLLLSDTGWVEVASRLPIALEGNKKYKFPGQLVRGDHLLTGCRIVQKPKFVELNWTTVYLDTKDCSIPVPNCIPLALS